MSDFKFDPVVFQETQAKTKEALIKLKKAKADFGIECKPEMEMPALFEKTCTYIDSLNYTIESLQRQLSYLSQSFYDYQQKHLPEVPGPAGLKSALKGLGWLDDYEVQPRTVYASVKDGWVKIDGKEIKI